MLLIYVKVILRLFSLAGEQLPISDATDNICIMYLQCKLGMLDLTSTQTAIKNKLFFSWKTWFTSLKEKQANKKQLRIGQSVNQMRLLLYVSIFKARHKDANTHHSQKDINHHKNNSVSVYWKQILNSTVTKKNLGKYNVNP